MTELVDARWLVWITLGLLGALGQGLLRNGLFFGGGLLLAPVAMAIYDLARVRGAGETVTPPLVCLGLIVLLGGYAAVRLRPFIEHARSRSVR